MEIFVEVSETKIVTEHTYHWLMPHDLRIHMVIFNNVITFDSISIKIGEQTNTVAFHFVINTLLCWAEKRNGEITYGYLAHLPSLLLMCVDIMQFTNAWLSEKLYLSQANAQDTHAVS